MGNVQRTILWCVLAAALPGLAGAGSLFIWGWGGASIAVAIVIALELLVLCTARYVYGFIWTVRFG